MSQSFQQEFNAMEQIANITSELSAEERMRVAAWFVEYASQAVGGCSCTCQSHESTPEEDQTPAAEEEAEPKTFQTFAQLYEAVAPKTGAQKAATAGYWFQTALNQESWKASEVNKLLKQIDVKVSSVSIVLTNAVKASDPLIQQLARLGDGERSRKTFCLTPAGVAFVEARI